MKKIILCVLLVIMCFPLLGFSKKDKMVEEISQLKIELSKPQNEISSVVMHAGGVTDSGILGSNSLQAVENSYNNGYRVYEIDFCWTEDGELVCIHDWDAYYAKRQGKKSLSLEEFEKVRYSTYGFTSLTLDHLCEWIRRHPDVLIITDIKENCTSGAKLIAEKYPYLRDNFCIQIYRKEEFDEVKSLGFDKIIWTLYQLPEDEKQDFDDIIEFSKTHELSGITFSIESINSHPEYIKKLQEANVPLFVHTVNDKKLQQELIKSGISGIYTDYGSYFAEAKKGKVEKEIFLKKI